MDSENKTTFSFRLLKREDRFKLRKAVEKVEKFTNIPEISNTLEIVIAEMCNHAVIRGLQRFYFKSNNIAYNDPETYKKGLESFQLNYSYLNLFHYEREMKLLNLKVNVNIDLSEKCLFIHIHNPPPMHEVEEQHLRESLKKIMQTPYKDITDIDNRQKETTPYSLGLNMIVFLLSHLGLNPTHFRIYNKEANAIARLEFPLSETHVLRRDIKQKSVFYL